MPATQANPATNLVEAREQLRGLVREHGLGEQVVTVVTRPSATQESTGEGIREEYALTHGDVVLVEATFSGAIGQALSDEPAQFSGTLDQALDIRLDTNGQRALFVATANAILAHLGLVRGTCHCEYPSVRECGWRVASSLWGEYPGADVGLIGFQRGFVEGLVEVFGTDRVHVADLAPENLGRKEHGVPIGDSAQDTKAIIESSDVVLVSGAMVVAGALEGILKTASEVQTPIILYGATAAAPAYLYNLPRVCPLAS